MEFSALHLQMKRKVGWEVWHDIGVHDLTCTHLLEPLTGSVIGGSHKGTVASSSLLNRRDPP